jgi:pyridoxamine 5'-phosphate oxidase-like protein
MGKAYSVIEGAIKEFIEAQRVFFVGSAPLDAGGHVNVSPKGLDTLRILGPTKVAYLDLTGSGIETVAHVKENGRIVLMFCAFQGPPKILRLHGRGRVVEPHDTEFASLVSLFPAFDAVRSIIVVELSDISDSCGYGVPLLRHEGEREQLGAWARRKGPEGIRTYQQERNRQSLDGLPGLTESAAAVKQE